MEWKLWAMALILALLWTQLDFSPWRMKGNGTLETQGCNSIGIKLSTISNAPMQVSENAFSCDITINPHPPATGGDKAHSPLITVPQK